MLQLFCMNKGFGAFCFCQPGSGLCSYAQLCDFPGNSLSICRALPGP